MRKRKNKIAVVTARGLGDALISMILSQNLLSSGNHVTTFSTILCQMSDWFPEHQILPHPTRANFAHFDHVYAADHSQVTSANATTTILKESHFDKRRSMVENLVSFCEERQMGGQSDTGLVVLPSLTHQKYSKRVILHPESADPKKNWPASKYRKLFEKLKKRGFDPVIIVAPDERENWQEAPFFPSLSAVAAYIYESGFFIGNDSGLGHLASLLRIPTLSLFARKSYSRLWRPGWGRGRVAAPLMPLIGAPMKERYWKNFLTTNHVLHHFNCLT